MDDVTRVAWEQTLKKLESISPDRRKHFALVLLQLADCYVDDSGSMGVLLVDKQESMMTISIGATEMECANIVMRAYEVMGEVMVADAPAKEMFN